MTQVSAMSYELIQQLPECGVFSSYEETNYGKEEEFEQQLPWISDESQDEEIEHHPDDDLYSYNFHPFLDMETQKMQVEYDKQQRLAEYCARMSAEQQLSPENQTVALKLVMHEAHRLQKVTKQLTATECKSSWKTVGANACRDMYVEGHQYVQRRLSCMCIFNPVGGKKEYVDSDADRIRRQSNQQQVLRTLAQQAAFGGNPYFIEGSQL